MAELHAYPTLENSSTMAPLEATISRHDMAAKTKPAMINYVSAIFA